MNDMIVESRARRAPFWTLLSLTAVAVAMGALGGCGSKPEPPPPASAGQNASDNPDYQKARENAAKK